MKPTVFLAAFIALSSLSACSPDSTPDAADAAPGGHAGSPSGDAAPPARDSGASRTPDAFNGDCSTANWSSKSSDACWACMCNHCAATLNKCNDGCVSLMECGIEKHVLVGKVEEVACEVRAFSATCLNDPATSPQSDATTAFDVCLIGARLPSSMLRICEPECGLTYTGDVCERFPAPEAGTK